jgi:hypothetical protein
MSISSKRRKITPNSRQDYQDRIPFLQACFLVDHEPGIILLILEYSLPKLIDSLARPKLADDQRQEIMCEYPGPDTCAARKFFEDVDHLCFSIRTLDTKTLHHLVLLVSGMIYHVELHSKRVTELGRVDLSIAKELCCGDKYYCACGETYSVDYGYIAVSGPKKNNLYSIPTYIFSCQQLFSGQSEIKPYATFKTGVIRIHGGYLYYAPQISTGEIYVSDLHESKQYAQFKLPVPHPEEYTWNNTHCTQLIDFEVYTMSIVMRVRHENIATQNIVERAYIVNTV